MQACLLKQQPNNNNMKHVKQSVNKLQNALFLTLVVSTLFMFPGCEKKEPEMPLLNITTLASGLKAPIGVEVDNQGRVWVTESGIGKNDGKVSVITKNGKKYDAVINLESVIFNGEPDGPTHLLFADGFLYILGTHGKMYKANVSTFTPGNAPLDASSLAVEDIGAFVLAHDFKNETNDSHPYNLTKGPDGAIYITDAGANAIIRRSASGALSVVAEIPGIPNPTSIGPPQIESVPTGIIFDGQNFLVTTLLGFPFPAGKALIYKVSPSGTVAVYQQGFNSLVDIAKGGSMGRLVLEHGMFGAMGFAPNTGRLVWANGTTAPVLADGLNLPVGMVQADEHTWYVTSLGDGSVLKVTY